MLILDCDVLEVILGAFIDELKPSLNGQYDIETFVVSACDPGDLLYQSNLFQWGGHSFTRLRRRSRIAARLGTSGLLVKHVLCH